MGDEKKTDSSTNRRTILTKMGGGFSLGGDPVCQRPATRRRPCLPATLSAGDEGMWRRDGEGTTRGPRGDDQHTTTGRRHTSEGGGRWRVGGRWAWGLGVGESGGWGGGGWKGMCIRCMCTGKYACLCTNGCEYMMYLRHVCSELHA